LLPLIFMKGLGMAKKRTFKKIGRHGHKECESDFCFTCLQEKVTYLYVMIASTDARLSTTERACNDPVVLKHLDNARYYLSLTKAGI